MNNLTGRQLVEQGIITQCWTIGDRVPEENIQQHGVDLCVIRIEQVDGTTTNGLVSIEGKTKLAQRIFVEPREEGPQGKRKPYWYLMPGAYDITCAQGCKVPADKMLLIRQRSSLLRNGTVLHSSVFDAGFETDKIGTVMIVLTPIEIEVGARVAQIYAHNSNVIEDGDLYAGQWQGDKQRNEQTP